MRNYAFADVSSAENLDALVHFEFFTRLTVLHHDFVTVRWDEFRTETTQKCFHGDSHVGAQAAIKQSLDDRLAHLFIGNMSSEFAIQTAK
jgi:hypothetical protein